MSRCRLLRFSREAGVISGGDGGFETESAVDARASFVELGRRSTLAAIAAMGRTPHPSHEEALGAKKPAGEADQHDGKTNQEIWKTDPAGWKEIWIERMEHLLEMVTEKGVPAPA